MNRLLTTLLSIYNYKLHVFSVFLEKGVIILQRNWLDIFETVVTTPALLIYIFSSNEQTKFFSDDLEMFRYHLQLGSVKRRETLMVESRLPFFSTKKHIHAHSQPNIPYVSFKIKVMCQLCLSPLEEFFRFKFICHQVQLKFIMSILLYIILVKES